MNSDLTYFSRFTEVWENCIIDWKFSQQERAAASPSTPSQKRDGIGKMYQQLTRAALPNEKQQRSAEPQAGDSNISCSSQISPTGNAGICATCTTQHAYGKECCSKTGTIFWGEQVFHSKRHLFGKISFIIWNSLACIRVIWFNFPSG